MYSLGTTIGIVGRHDRLILIFTCDAAIPFDVMNAVRTLRLCVIDGV